MADGHVAAEVRHMRAWLLLVGVLTVHAADETLTDFLGFYNPLVLGVRQRIPWFPLPTFTFGPWIAGLSAIVVLLLVASLLLARATWQRHHSGRL